MEYETDEETLRFDDASEPSDEELSNDEISFDDPELTPHSSPARTDSPLPHSHQMSSLPHPWQQYHVMEPLGIRNHRRSTVKFLYFYHNNCIFY